MSLLSNIYNSITKFFRSQEEQGSDASKSVATNRLKIVLMQDRTNLTPKILEQMRGELIELLSRYVELDKELLDLNFEQEGDQIALMLSIPVIRAKDEDEIEAAILEHKKSLGLINDETEEETLEQESEETDTTVNDEQRTEEEIAESEKTEAIVQELQDVPKIIKKKVSTPTEMSGNPFKNDEAENLDLTETSVEK